MDAPPQRRICVTGASGFIASHIVLALLRAGYAVNATLRASKHAERVRNHLRALHPSAPTNLHFFEADLLEPGSFDAAVAGCEVVMHTASPVRAISSDPISQLIDPAVRGTENVLRACQRSPSVRTMVMTGSYAAIVGEGLHRDSRVWNESDWNNEADLTAEPYALGKLLAEELAWRFVKAENVQFKLIVLHPTITIGPLLLNRLPVSVSPIWDILRGQICSPQLFFPFVDVRDVAQAHLLAFQNPNAPSRCLLCSSSMWWKDWARLISARHPEYPIGYWNMPNLLGYFVGLIHPRVSFMWVWRRLGRSFIVDASRSQHELNLTYTPPEQTLYDCAESLITRGMVPAPSGARREALRTLRALLLAMILWSLFLRRRVQRWLIR